MDREALVAHWLDLTRRVLPGMADAYRWPIRFDHCFMRVCLDNALGTVWHTRVSRPAIRHLTDAQLQDAVTWAERIVADPALLPALNRRSLEWRRT